MKTENNHIHSTLALVLLAAALLLAAMLVGCGGSSKKTAVKLPPLPAGLSAPVYVVINDVTTHPQSTSDARAAAFEALARSAWEHGAGLVLVTVGSTPGSVRTVFSTVAVVNEENGTYNRLRQNARTQAMLELFRASDAEQTTGTANVVAALREVQAAAREIRRTLEQAEKSLSVTNSLPVERLLRDSSQEVRQTIDYASAKVLRVIGIFLAGQLILLLVAARLFRPHSPKPSQQDSKAG